MVAVQSVAQISDKTVWKKLDFKVQTTEKERNFWEFSNANQGQQNDFSWGNLSKLLSKELWNTTKMFELQPISRMKKEDGGKERDQ